MEPPPAGSPPDDPFFAPLRGRHPDVDLVLLPPEPARRPEHLDASCVAAAAEQAARTAALLGAGAGLASETGTRLGFGPDPGTVVATARLVESCAEDATVLDRLAGVGAGDGWEVHLRAGAVASLVGRGGDLRLRATYAAATRALVVEVASMPLAVGSATARDLVRGRS